MAAMYDVDWAAAEQHFDFPMAKQAVLSPSGLCIAGFSICGAMWSRRSSWHSDEDVLEVWARMNLHAYLQAGGREKKSNRNRSRRRLVPARRLAMPVPMRFFTGSAAKSTGESIGWKRQFEQRGR
jgi:hypothetical protein